MISQRPCVSRQARLLLLTVALGGAGVAADTTPVEQENPPGTCPLETPTYGPMEFKMPTTKPCVWKRPENVEYVLIKACGGGGGGVVGEYVAHLNVGNGHRAQPHWRLSSGGRAALISSTLVGPLTQDSYQVSIGSGGAANKPGTATTFVGEDPVAMTYRPGGAGGATGQATPWAQPGKGWIYGNITNATVGGDAGLGPGGDTYQFDARDPRKNKAGTAGAACAGGGAGMEIRRETLAAGAGGPGYLLIIPVLPFQPASD